jgi:hypothetical protein
LDNDTAGPDDEVQPPQSQTISLVAGQFPITTTAGGVVSLTDDNTLTYTPAARFSGTDTFSYQVMDSEGAVASAFVSINVGGVNNEPVFIGINGDSSQTSITRDEAKVQAEQLSFDLTTWYFDPEGDDLQFSAVSSDLSVVSSEVIGDNLILTFQPFSFGNADLEITATDPTGASQVTIVPVEVVGTPDPPSVIGTLNPLSGVEDQIVTADLGGVFADPDQQQLTYLVARIGTIVNPTAEQIASHPLVNSIGFVGDQLQIQLKQDQFGTADIEIAATDGSFRVSDSFTLTISPVADNPIATSDGYNVPVGSTLQILNPSDGLLRNDFDADGDAVSVDLTSVSDPLFGSVDVGTDGTFRYTSNTGDLGDVDQFTYRVLDATGRSSGTVTVSLTLNQSRYQNPLTDLSEDVNADGQISAIDALRIINFLNRELVNDSAISVPVSEIGAPPPDYFDANGDGRVSSGDALKVINMLRRINNGEGESISAEAALGVTTSFASGSNAGLPVRNLEPVTTITAEDPRDALLAVGLEITAPTTEKAVDAFSTEPAEASRPESVDEALSLVLGEFTLGEDLD